MPSLSNPFILGYHGCSRKVGEAILNGKSKHLKQSKNRWDWLGWGVYFWEADPQRGYDWAVQKYGADDAFVVGAAIQLGNCLDLMSQSSLMLLQSTFDSFKVYHEQSYPGTPMPENRETNLGPSYALDCAVINHLHYTFKTHEPTPLPRFNTVRGLYQEGDGVFTGSKIMAKTHIQICVRTPKKSIQGYLRVPESHYGR